MLNGDMFAFADENEAYMTLDAIKDVNYHFDVTILDMCGLCLADIQSELIPDPDDGWKRGTLSTVKIEHVCDAYLLCMPPMNIKEDKTMDATTNKTCDYTATPEELELNKAIKEAQDEAEKKILDIRIELSKKLEALRSEYQEKEAVKREERQAHAWKRKYDALLKEGFSVEQAWEMTMKSFEMN